MTRRLYRIVTEETGEPPENCYTVFQRMARAREEARMVAGRWGQPPVIIVDDTGATRYRYYRTREGHRREWRVIEERAHGSAAGGPEGRA